MSLGFTLIGAFIFAMVKGHEADIPAGSHHRHLLRGRVGRGHPHVEQGDRRGRASAEHAASATSCPCSGRKSQLTGAIYLAIGIFHYIFRKRFLEISIDTKAAAARGVPVRLWDFLFYASFGFVVTRSVAIAGVLLVFCYLIVAVGRRHAVPAHIGRRLAIGWIMGVVVSMLGMYLSVQFDLPTGATIVCTFGLVLAVMAAVRPLLLRLGNHSAAIDTTACCRW